MVDESGFVDVDAFLARWRTTSAKRRSRVAAAAPLDRIKRAAVHHPDAFVRRDCVAFLDHYANDDSAAVFASALADPVDFVRHFAVHSIACETCKTDQLIASDVVPHLVAMLHNDPSVEIRHKTIAVLLRLADRDPRARAAVEHAAEHDPDRLLREVATRALAGEHVRARKMYERHGR